MFSLSVCPADGCAGLCCENWCKGIFPANIRQIFLHIFCKNVKNKTLQTLWVSAVSVVDAHSTANCILYGIGAMSFLGEYQELARAELENRRPKGNQDRMSLLARAEGPKAPSPGQRPGFPRPMVSAPCKGKSIKSNNRDVDIIMLLPLQVGCSKFDTIFCTILDSKYELIH